MNAYIKMLDMQEDAARLAEELEDQLLQDREFVLDVLGDLTPFAEAELADMVIDAVRDNPRSAISREITRLAWAKALKQVRKQTGVDLS